MLPIGDDNSTRKATPIITYLLILLNIFVFILELIYGEEFILKWAFIPSHFIKDPVSNFPNLLTSMFMHAGWGHLIGNMLYLWIFGDNVEDRLGKIKYLIFYLICGTAATFAQLIFHSNSSIPNLGASGAIAGVLGAYLILFPQGKVYVLVGQHLTEMSALIVIGFWFVLQFFSQIASPETSGSEGDTGGVAYMAHIGGFIAGMIMTYFIKATEKK